MPEHRPIPGEGVVIGLLAPGVCRVRMANGHEAVAHRREGVEENENPFLPGDRVLVVFSPYDLSRARIVTRLETPPPGGA